MKYTVVSLPLFLVMVFGACQPSSSPEAETSPNPAAEPKITPAMAEEDPEIQHVVCFKFKDNASQDAIQKHMDDFAALRSKIPEIQDYEDGNAFKVDYEKTADYDVVHYVTFQSEADLETYFHHPAHQEFIQENKEIWADVFVINSKTE